MSKPVVTKKTVTRSKAALVVLSVMSTILGGLALYVNRQTMLTLVMNYLVLAVVLIAYHLYRQDLYDYQFAQLERAAEEEQKRAEEQAKEGESNEP